MKRGDLVRVVERGGLHFCDVGRILRTVPRIDIEGFGFVVALSFDRRVPPPEIVSLVPAEGEYEWNPILEYEADNEFCSIGVSHFLPEYLKPLGAAGQKFWNVFLDRNGLHRASVRRGANHATNLMRNHREEEAARKAAHCHPINLLLSAMGQPHGFLRATRLDLEGYVNLCRAAGKDMDEVADILSHMLFENREQEKIGDLLPVCTCDG